MQLNDSARRYGKLTRILHWTMALLFAWQFGGMIVKELLGKTPLVGFWVGTHASVGTLLLVLLMVRALWGLSQMSHRPPYHSGVIGLAARLGHLGLYALMLIVPALALLRMFGSGRGARLFGVQLQQGGGEKVDWMVAPASLLHGTLAWVLLALVAGHVAMVFVHRFIWRDDVASRMIGRAR